MKYIYFFLIFMLCVTPANAQQTTTTVKCDTIVSINTKPKSIKRSTKRKSTHVNSRKNLSKKSTPPKISCNTDTLSREGVLIPIDSLTDPNWEINPQVIGAFRKTQHFDSKPQTDSIIPTQSKCISEYTGNFGTKEFDTEYNTSCKSSGNILAPLAFLAGAVVFFISGDGDSDGSDDPLTCKNPHHHHGHKH